MQSTSPEQVQAPVDVAAMDAGQLLQRLTRCLIHNMSNPMAAIVGCAQLLDRVLERGGPVDADQCRVYAGMIFTEAEKCSRALDRLALLARPPVPRPLPMDVHEVIQRALEAFALPEGICVALEREAWEPLALVDADLMAHVLANLLQNAAEAMPEGGTVTISTANHDEGGVWVRITVADEGPGIAPDALPHVAEPFFSTRQRQNGIGLTICTQLVSRQGGRFLLTSESPGGVRAAVDLPRAN